MMLVVLVIVQLLALAAGFDAGAGTCTVLPDFSNIQQFGAPAMASRTRNQSPGDITVSEAFGSNTYTPTNNFDDFTILTWSSANGIAGIMGYAVEAGTTNKFGQWTFVPFNVGDPVIIQTEWVHCPDTQSFTHNDVTRWGTQPRTSVTVFFHVPAGNVSSTPSLSADNQVLSMGLTRPGTIYWVLADINAPAPSFDQMKLGQDGNGAAAFRSGSTPVTSANLNAQINLNLPAEYHLKLYAGAEWINPNVEIVWYVLRGTRGNTASEQFFRAAPGEASNFILTPSIRRDRTPIHAFTLELTVNHCLPNVSTVCGTPDAICTDGLNQFTCECPEFFRNPDGPNLPCIPCPTSCRFCTATGCLVCDGDTFPQGVGCAACTVCDSDQFMVSDCETTDRVCQDCTVCAPDEFELSPCGANFDTVCDVRTNCDELFANCTSCNMSECLECLPGFFLNELGRCEICAVGCDECNITHCTLCSDDFWFNGTRCLACTQCGEGSFQEAPCTEIADTICPACSANCSVCFNATQCVICDDNFRVNGSICSICEECIFPCEEDEWQDENGTCRPCKRCPYGVRTIKECDFHNDTVCDSSPPPCTITHCTRCSSGRCDECEQGWTLSNGACVQCPSYCAVCDGYGRCTQCSSGYVLDYGICRACPSHCATCDRYNRCTACVSGYVLAYGQCGNCNTLFPGCSACTTSRCTECSDGYFLRYGQCTACSTSCRDGSYISTPCSGTTDCVCSLCTRVTSNCARCTANGCSRCYDGYYLREGVCVACSSRFSNCARCNSSACTTCNSNYYLNSNGNCRACSTCTPPMEVRTPCGSDNDTVCQRTCGSYCDACDNGTCTRCRSGYYLSGGQCRACTICSDGSYCSRTCGSTTDAICTRCSANCATCDAYGCTSCSSSDYYLNRGQCYRCSTCSTYVSRRCTATTDTVCAPCGDHCTNCNSYGCTVCERGYYLRNGQCYACSSCGRDSYVRTQCSATSDTVCQRCCSSCSSCTSTGCLSCDSGYYLRYGQCTACSTCTSGYYVSRQCSATSNTQCTACRSCSGGTYPAGGCSGSVDTICTACGSNCDRCTSSGCTRCASGYYLKNGRCTACSSCSRGSYVSRQCSSNTDTVCSSCGNYCSNCGSYGCTACSSGYELRNGQCQACGTISVCVKDRNYNVNSFDVRVYDADSSCVRGCGSSESVWSRCTAVLSDRTTDGSLDLHINNGHYIVIATSQGRYGSDDVTIKNCQSKNIKLRF